VDFPLEIEQIKNLIYPNADFPLIREKLQRVFDSILFSECENREEKLSAAFTLLRKTDNLDFPKTPCEYRINLSALTENLVFCCDAVLCESEKRILFLSDENDIYINADPKIVTRAILGAVSNAVGYSQGGFIAVSLYRVGENAALSFENSGDFDISEYLRSLDGTGGLSFISKTVRLYNGCLLMCSDGGKTSFLFSLPASGALNAPEYRTPDIDELLFDRLGAVYEALYRLTIPDI